MDQSKVSCEAVRTVEGRLSADTSANGAAEAAAHAPVVALHTEPSATPRTAVTANVIFNSRMFITRVSTKNTAKTKPPTPPLTSRRFKFRKMG